MQGTISTHQIITTISKDRIKKWNTYPNNGNIPANNNNNTQFMDINQLDTIQNIPNDGDSFFNGNQEVNQICSAIIIIPIFSSMPCC